MIGLEKKTMYPWFIESICWVFKQLETNGFRVMHYSTGCPTPLGNFGVTQNYMDVFDPAMIVFFPVDIMPGVSLIAGYWVLYWSHPSGSVLWIG
jgi:isoleucyl-tRNA synthetase